MCNYKACQFVLPLVILVFAFWETTWSKWIIVVAAALILLYSLGCKAGGRNTCVPNSKPVAKKKARKKRK